MRGLTGFLCVLLMLAGCTSKPARQEDPAAARLRKVAQAYQLASDKGRPPRKAEDLEETVRRMAPMLERLAS